jgi:predicted O-methyltransferase YrrM
MPATHDLALTAKRAGYRVATPRWLRLRDEAGGMLSPLVYRRMYRAVRAQPDLDVVEIGGAAGAGSISLAWGMRDAGHTAKLIVVERCEGGSRAAFGGYDDNLARLHANFERFGVADRIELHPHEITLENGADVLARVTTSEIGAFVHDADGRLDRDVALFWPRLRPGGLVIVDDDDPGKPLRPGRPERPDSGYKGVLTYRLLRQLEAWGLFVRTAKVRNTTFGRKPVDADMRRFDPDVCARIVADVRAQRDDQLRNT